VHGSSEPSAVSCCTVEALPSLALPSMGSAASKSNAQEDEYEQLMATCATCVEAMNQNVAKADSIHARHAATLESLADLQQPMASLLQNIKQDWCSGLGKAHEDRFDQLTEKLRDTIFETLEAVPQMRRFYMEQKLGLDVLRTLRTFGSATGDLSVHVDAMLKKAHGTFEKSKLPQEKFDALAASYNDLISELGLEIQQLNETAQASRTRRKWMIAAAVILGCCVIVGGVVAAVAFKTALTAAKAASAKAAIADSIAKVAAAKAAAASQAQAAANTASQYLVQAQQAEQAARLALATAKGQAVAHAQTALHAAQQSVFAAQATVAHCAQSSAAAAGAHSAAAGAAATAAKTALVAATNASVAQGAAASATVYAGAVLVSCGGAACVSAGAAWKCAATIAEIEQATLTGDSAVALAEHYKELIQGCRSSEDVCKGAESYLESVLDGQADLTERTEFVQFLMQDHMMSAMDDYAESLNKLMHSADKLQSACVSNLAVLSRPRNVRLLASSPITTAEADFQFHGRVLKDSTEAVHANNAQEGVAGEASSSSQITGASFEEVRSAAI